MKVDLVKVNIENLMVEVVAIIPLAMYQDIITKHSLAARANPELLDITNTPNLFGTYIDKGYETYKAMEQ